jgi:hypothetical protein
MLERAAWSTARLHVIAPMTFQTTYILGRQGPTALVVRGIASYAPQSPGHDGLAWFKFRFLKRPHKGQFASRQATLAYPDVRQAGSRKSLCQ